MHRMSRRFKMTFSAWIAAERRGDVDQAERSLRRLFSVLPTPAPGSDLVMATLEQLGVRVGRRVRTVPGRLFKLLVSACLAIAGAALLLAPSVVGPPLRAINPAWVVELWTSALIAVSQRLAGGMAVWRVMSDVGDMVAAALASPATMAALAIVLVMSLVTFRALMELVAFERRTGNV